MALLEGWWKLTPEFLDPPTLHLQVPWSWP